MFIPLCTIMLACFQRKKRVLSIKGTNSSYRENQDFSQADTGYHPGLAAVAFFVNMSPLKVSNKESCYRLTAAGCPQSIPLAPEGIIFPPWPPQSHLSWKLGTECESDQDNVGVAAGSSPLSVPGSPGGLGVPVGRDVPHHSPHPSDFTGWQQQCQGGSDICPQETLGKAQSSMAHSFLAIHVGNVLGICINLKGFHQSREMHTQGG